MVDMPELQLKIDQKISLVVLLMLIKSEQMTIEAMAEFLSLRQYAVQ